METSLSGVPSFRLRPTFYHFEFHPWLGHGSLRPKSLLSKLPAMVMRWKYANTCLQFAVLPFLMLLFMGEQAATGDPALNLQTSRDNSVDIALDFDWAVEEAQYCHLRLRLLDDSSNQRYMIHELENQSDSDKTVAAFTLSQDATQLTFHPRAQVNSVRVRLRVQGTPETRIVIESLDEPRNPEGVRIAHPIREISFADLLQKKTLLSDTPFVASKTAKQRTRWSIRRAEDDEIRLAGLQAIPVYEPNETSRVGCRCQCHDTRSVFRADLPLLDCSGLEPKNSGTTPENQSASMSNGNSDVIPIAESVPETPGVYEIRCHLSGDDDRIWDRLRGPRSTSSKTRASILCGVQTGKQRPARDRQLADCRNTQALSVKLVCRSVVTKNNHPFHPRCQFNRA